ncbi:MAG: nuclear transport factor 2 family protein [Sphingomonas sp.]
MDDPLTTIARVMAAYHYHGDRGDNRARALCFAPAGILETALWMGRGREEIVRLLEARLPVEGRAPHFVRHHLTTSHVALDAPGEASGISYFMVFTDSGLDHAGVYEDSFVHAGSDWLIAHRRVRIDWKAEASFLRQPLWWGP